MTDWSTIWPVAVSILTLALGVQTYRLRRASSLLHLPYIEPRKLHNSSAPRLGGEHADKWHIERVSIRRPRDASFLDQRLEHDAGGSIINSRLVEIGRQMADPEGYALYVRSQSWPVELSFLIALRSSPKTKRSLTVLWRE